MAETLYRKYRPQTFADVVGQNHIKTTLQHELEREQLAHAYLFSGPRGLGKTTTARLLAKAVNCQKRKNGTSEPCNSCDMCTEIMGNRSIDVIEMDAASHTGVDNVRENVISNAAFTPTRGKFKVFIIDEVHMLSTSAFNALLKTLEEPPAHAMFILATTELHKVPETIISRCQHFDFRKVSHDQIIGRLNHLVSAEKKKVDKEVLETIAYTSHGCLRDAESLLGQVLSLDDKHITQKQAELVLPQQQLDVVVSFAEVLIKRDAPKALTIVNQIVQDGVNLEQFTAELVEVLRIILVTKINPDASRATWSAGVLKQCEVLAKTAAQDFLIKAVETFMEAKQQIRYAEVPQLVLEIAVLKLIAQNETGSEEKVIEPVVEKKTVVTKKETPTPSVVEVKKTTVIEEKEEERVASVSRAIKTTLSDVEKKWNNILEATKNYNHSLAAVLRLSQIVSVNTDGTVQVACSHGFHQQRINDQKNRTILEQIFQEIFGEIFVIKAIVDTNLQAVSTESADEGLTEEENFDSIDTIASAFGGKVVS